MICLRPHLSQRRQCLAPPTRHGPGDLVACLGQDHLIGGRFPWHQTLDQPVQPIALGLLQLNGRKLLRA